MMKGLRKVFSSSLAMWREWRTIGLQKEYVGECAGISLVGRPQKRWTDTVKDCSRKRGLDVRQARRMVQDRSEWRGLVRGNAWECSPGDESLA